MALLVHPLSLDNFPSSLARGSRRIWHEDRCPKSRKTPSDRNAVLRVSSPLSKAPPTSDAPSWYVPLLDRGSSFLDARRTRYEVVGNGVRVTRYGYEVRGTVCLMSGSAVRGTCCEVRSTGYLQPGYSMPGVRGTRSEVPASKLCCSRCKKCFTFHDSCSLGNYLSATKRVLGIGQ